MVARAQSVGSLVYVVIDLVRESRECVSCGHSCPIQFLDLGDNAFANSFLTDADLASEEPKAPLRMAFCEVCHLVQLTHIVKRSALFSNYAYFSSTSPQLIDHFGEYAAEIVDRLKPKFVVEIASNDGIMLKPMQQMGVLVLGIDPAKNVANTANSSGIRTIPQFFTSKLAAEIISNEGHADVVVANNILAHADRPNELLSAIFSLLSDHGALVVEVQYIVDLINGNQFDNCYHEHVSYFSFESLSNLFARNGFYAYEVKWVPTQGGSLRVYAKKHTLAVPPRRTSKALEQFSKEAHRLGDISSYIEFSKRPKQTRDALNEMIKTITEEGGIIAGYGAAAKGNTLLQYCGITNKSIRYIVDTAPSKIGRFTPGTHIPVVSINRLKEDTPDYIILLAWNYADSIMENESWFKDHGGKWIIPIPGPVII